MDPPPYGRGPQGEKWTLHEQLDELVGMCSSLLEERNAFFVMSTYAVGLSPMVGRNVVVSHFGDTQPASGELYLKSQGDKDLPMGTFLRFTR
jgi:23S rRNA (cytosine1962-C5)-methyltransferase